MPIAVLPTITVRAIGSAQTLTDSPSLVKELIDNAIDSRATNISVEISVNALDEIRVKDNGHGINPEDRALVCKRYCTSKIRTLEDLHQLGGRSLGFRGEALASATEMSACFTISTRIEGEETASELKFDRQGNIANEKRTSHPIGTTVRVEKFLDTLPVRRQAAEKTSVKMLAKVKRLLQAYALARPQLRLSLKILKAKNDKGNWKYPKAVGIGNSNTRASAFNAATEILGRKMTDQCQRMCSSFSSNGQQIDRTFGDSAVSARQDENYTFDAVLAKLDRGISLISNVGQYVSIDERPVSCARGTFKQIITLYKSHLRSLNATEEVAKINDPFLCMNIVCPPGSYDANIEPAKDDVLFSNPDLVLRLTEKFFRDTYGETQPALPIFPPQKSPLRPRGIELLPARKPSPKKDISNTAASSSASSCQSPLSSERSVFGGRTMVNPEAPRNSGSVSRIKIAQDIHQGLKSLSHVIYECSDGSEALNQELSMVSPSLDHALLPSSPEGYSEYRSKNSMWKASMYADDEDDIEEFDEILGQRATSEIEEDIDECTLRSAKVSNPWTLAKLNAPFRPLGRNKSPAPNGKPNPQLPTPGRQLGDAGDSTEPSSEGIPLRSGDVFPQDLASSSPDPFPFPLKAWGKPKGSDAERLPAESNNQRCARGGLDIWVQRPLQHTAGLNNKATNNGVIDPSMNPTHPQPKRDFVSAATLPMGTPLSDIPDASQRPRRKLGPRKQQQGSLNKSSISPVNDPQHVWFNTGETSRRKQTQQARSREDIQNSAAAGTLMLRGAVEEEGSVSPNAVLRPMHPDLAFTMDYEARKQKAIEQRRETLRQQAAAEKLKARLAAHASSNNSPANSPHRNRRNKAIAVLHTEDDSSLVETLPPAFELGDPRAYLLRVQQREEAERKAGSELPKSKRWRTTMLPFETLREDTYIGDLILQVKTEDLDIELQMEKGGTCDEYIDNGKDVEALASATTVQVTRWERALKEMVKNSYRIEGMEPEEEMDGDLGVDLVTIWRNHVAKTADLTVV